MKLKDYWHAIKGKFQTYDARRHSKRMNGEVLLFRFYVRTMVFLDIYIEGYRQKAKISFEYTLRWSFSASPKGGIVRYFHEISRGIHKRE